jgi:succinate dehydrogenase / fumarate reductase, cytochrome b subunit
MSHDSLGDQSGERTRSFLERTPFLSFYARTRGDAFVLSWFHRLAGIAMVLFVWMHLYTLSSLTNPAGYDAKMSLFKTPLLAFLEWALAIPLIYHSLNGGRLILYEIFGVREDVSMIRWVWGLSFLYLFLLGLLMFMGNQQVSAVFFWLVVFVSGSILFFGVTSRIWMTGQTRVWKLQRMTGVFLLMMVPAHMMFMHLNLPVGHQAQMVMMRMQDSFIKVVDLTLLWALLYHGGYGLISVLGDYLSCRSLRIGGAALIAGIMALCALWGSRIIFVI